MGNERITSKLSNSGIFAESPVKDTLQAKYQLQSAKIKERFDTLGVKYNGVAQTNGLASTPPLGAGGSYYYHSDHLGSSSLITDGTGHTVQHIEYIPFGETFIEERNSTWNTPYKFNAKELDEETGLYYYGARYYDPRTSVWLSVDPLKGKTLNVSAYVYCYNNPIRYIDPDGRFVLKIGAIFYKATHKNENWEAIGKDKITGRYFVSRQIESEDGTAVAQRYFGKTNTKSDYDQIYGEHFTGGAGFGHDGFGARSRIHGNKDIDLSMFGSVSGNVKNKAEWAYEMAKKIYFFADFIDVPMNGVEMDLPEMEEPEVIIEFVTRAHILGGCANGKSVFVDNDGIQHKVGDTLGFYNIKFTKKGNLIINSDTTYRKKTKQQ